MTKYTIILNQKKCIGCGACMLSNPIYYKILKTGKMDIVNSKINKSNKNEKILKSIKQDYELNLRSSKSCPVNCILILKE
ncbi:MAG: ferredoxin [Nanoarchaeota archaeon]